MIENTITVNKILTKVDRLVADVIAGKFNIQQVFQDLQYLYPLLMMHYDYKYNYTQTVDWFIEVTQVLKGDVYPHEVLWDYKSTCQFIFEIQKYRDQLLKIKNEFKVQELKNTDSLTCYLSQLIEHYSRLLFIRIDLRYTYDSKVDITDFDEHVTKLTQRLSNKKGCFKDLEGYAWALEQGSESGGLHCHLLLIYNGSKRNNDWYIAKQVGEKWTEITEGLGSYYNCHDPKHLSKYKSLGLRGIGMIHRDQSVEVENAIRSSVYLTSPIKFAQRLKVKLPNMRSFGHGYYRISKRRCLPSQY